jgi:hypothetical protein
MEMSADNENGSAELQARERAQNDITSADGKAWVERLEPEFAKLPKLTYVVINCRTGEYVTGSTLLEAADEFERRFTDDVGYAHQVGGGFFVGWGGGIV